MKKLLLDVFLLLSLCFALTACGNQTVADIQSQSADAGDASSGISDDIAEYGLLSSYDSDTGELTYIPAEIVDESDTQRIGELEAQGIDVDCSNGYFVYQSKEIELHFAVSESVCVSLLNDAYVLEKSDMDALANRLEGHPQFFLCQLHLVEGVITEIEEIFIP